MGKLKYIIGLLLLIVTITSCKDDFLDTKPLDEYSEVDVWTDPALVETFVNNFYFQMGNPLDIDMIACYVDEAHFTPGWGVSDFNNSLLTVDQIPGWEVGWFGINTVWRRWNELYRAIRSTNIFFAKIGESVFDDQDLKDRLTGEAYFARAYFYHMLTSLYGGVPIIKDPYGLSDEFTIARDSYEDCINFIVEDLDNAADLLAGLGNIDEGRASEGAALALKSRVLLYAASELHNNNSLFSGFSNSELLGYTGGDATTRWTAAKNAAKALIDLGDYSLYKPDPATAEEATQNYIEYFTSMGTSEDIFLRHYFTTGGQYYEGWDNSMPGLFCGPNGYHNWGNNCPLGNLVDSYEMADGSKFSWDNASYAADPYGEFGGMRRDPRFYANTLYEGAQWRARPTDAASIDPDGIIRVGKWETSATDEVWGLDTRKGPIEDWNGGYSGYYTRKMIDPVIDAQFELQYIPFRWIRLAEIYLNYAEACIELGEDGEARKYINMVRRRAGMPAIDDTGADLKARYRNERKIELCYEEHRFYDVRRWVIGEEGYADGWKVNVVYKWDGSATATQPTYTPEQFETRNWDNKAYFFPIYRDEMNKNNLLIQNPGY